MQKIDRNGPDQALAHNWLILKGWYCYKGTYGAHYWRHTPTQSKLRVEYTLKYAIEKQMQLDLENKNPCHC